MRKESELDKNQVRIGVGLSYILIVINTVYGLFITPYMIGCLGDSEYGVYKTIASLASALMVLDLGIGGTVMRYVAKYRAEKKDEEIPNFIAMNLVQASIMCVVIGMVSIGVFQTIDVTYSSTFSDENLIKAKQLFIILILNMLLHVFENVINGVITGCNQFVFGNGVKVVRLLMRILLIFVLLKRIPNSIVIVLIDLFITMLFLCIELIYVHKKLNIKIKLVRMEKSLFWESSKYTSLMFLTSIAVQVNNNLDNVIIGAISGPTFVTVYSMGLLIFGMFENLSTSISGVMLPTVTTLLKSDNCDEKIEQLVIRIGRFQLMLLGAALTGFVCIGKEFISSWLGSGYEDVYIITLILMIPSLFVLCINVCLAVLRAKNMLAFRTIVLFATTALNTIVTVILVKYWSYIGAAFGTALSLTVGSLVVMNIYYCKKLKYHMLRIYKKIFSRIWICLLISGGVLILSSCFVSGGWISIIIKIMIFAVVYGATLFLFGFNSEEKKSIPILNKVYKKIKDK